MDAAKKKEILTNVIIVVCTLIIAFLMVRFELVKRAKREYNEGDRYLSFYRSPDLKKQYYDEKLKKKEISETEYEMLMEDNALKNAYVQYNTVIDLFTPPESKWVKLSRQRLSEITPEYNAWVEKLRKEIDDAPYTAPKK
jgi:hypothetical protein